MAYDNVRFEEGSVFLVTGVAGFIGSNLVEVLCSMGHQVKGLDDLSNGVKANVDRLQGEFSNFEFIEGTIEDIEVCRRACEGVDYVLHQAAWGSVPRSMTMPLKYQSVNNTGTMNMLQAATENNVKRFVYASSSSVYGDEPTLPKQVGREGNVLSPYAMTKRMNEEWAEMYWRLYKLPTIGMRYFNVFGKLQDPNGAYAAVIPKFAKALMNGERPQVHGDGEQSRDFTYIENVIEANLKACLAGEEAFGRAYNIAYGERFTVNQMLKAMCEQLEVEFNPEYVNPRAGDIKHSLANIDDTRELLGYEPSWSFADGFKATVEWYKENLFKI